MGNHPLLIRHNFPPLGEKESFVFMCVFLFTLARLCKHAVFVADDGAE